MRAAGADHKGWVGQHLEGGCCAHGLEEVRFPRGHPVRHLAYLHHQKEKKYQSKFCRVLQNPFLSRVQYHVSVAVVQFFSHTCKEVAHSPDLGLWVVPSDYTNLVGMCKGVVCKVQITSHTKVS